MTDPAMDARTPIDDRWFMESIAFNEASARRKPLTLAEYDDLPEDDVWLEELVRGHIVREPPPTPYHGTVQANLARLLGQHARSTGTGFVFTHGAVKTADDPEPSIRGPDVAYVSRQRAGESDLRGKRLQFAPDLAVEVVSPSNSAADLQEKVAEYFAAGSRQVWIVYPGTQQVMVYAGAMNVRLLGATDTLDGGDVMPGFSVQVSEIFEI